MDKKGGSSKISNGRWTKRSKRKEEEKEVKEEEEKGEIKNGQGPLTNRDTICPFRETELCTARQQQWK